MLALGLAVLLSGCSQAPNSQGARVSGSSDLAFAQHTQGKQDATGIEWTFWIHNNATTPSAPFTLHVSVSFSNSRAPPREQSQEFPSLAPGATQVVHLRTDYQGFGDYFGTAEILVGARVVARDPLFYEQCGASIPTGDWFTSIC